MRYVLTIVACLALADLASAQCVGCRPSVAAIAVPVPPCPCAGSCQGGCVCGCGPAVRPIISIQIGGRIVVAEPVRQWYLLPYRARHRGR